MSLSFTSSWATAVSSCKILLVFVESWVDLIVALTTFPLQLRHILRYFLAESVQFADPASLLLQLIVIVVQECLVDQIFKLHTRLAL